MFSGQAKFSCISGIKVKVPCNTKCPSQCTLQFNLVKTAKVLFLLTLFESEIQRHFVIEVVCHVFGFSRNIYSIGFFGVSKCQTIYCLVEVFT